LWVDGVWIGRGPARFSVHTHEYDKYNLGTLERGNHLIAVLVQWAPNNRRSESTTPHLVTQVEGEISGKKIFTAGTGIQWKSINSDAWKRNAVPVHAWGLIGPTELLDFRRLPADWMRPESNDENWPQAVPKDLAQVDYHPLIVPRLTGYESE
jgi:alpha-L-rhamnosidase